MSDERDVEAALVAGVLEEAPEGGVGAHAELGVRVDVEHAVAVGVDADRAISNSGMSVFHSPHTFTPKAWWMWSLELRARRRGRRCRRSLRA